LSPTSPSSVTLTTKASCDGLSHPFGGAQMCVRTAVCPPLRKSIDATSGNALPYSEEALASEWPRWPSRPPAKASVLPLTQAVTGAMSLRGLRTASAEARLPQRPAISPVCQISSTPSSAFLRMRGGSVSEKRRGKGYQNLVGGEQGEVEKMADPYKGQPFERVLCFFPTLSILAW